MNKVIVVVGFGPGISSSVAERFGREGFKVALVARNKSRLDAGVQALKAKGVEAAAFVADAGDPAAIQGAITQARAALGPITIVQWTAYSMGAGDVLAASSADLRSVFDVSVVGLTAAVQAALPDLKQTKGAVLVTNGGLGLFEPGMDAAAAQWNAMGLGIANSAKHKLVRVLSHKLKGDGVYVGEVVVLGSVKGTAFDQGNATIEPATVAEKFWSLYTARTDTSAQVG